MKLNQKQQLEALCTAIALGIADYQRNAALQNDYGNLDGVLHATSRMVFLRYLNDFFTNQKRIAETGEKLYDAPFAAVLEDIAIVAGVRVGETMRYSAIEPGSTLSPANGSIDREGSG